MPGLTLHLAATATERNFVPVEWRLGFTRPKGIAYIAIPPEIPTTLAPAIAEITAIRFLVDSHQVGTSLRHHEVIVSQYAVKDLMLQQSFETTLIPYGRYLYLYVDPAHLVVAKPTWALGLEIDASRISVTTTVPAAGWPSAYCQALHTTIGITHHAVNRFIERAHPQKTPWQAFQTISRYLGSPGMRRVPREEVAKTNPGMRCSDDTVVLHHPATDTAWIVLPEKTGWNLVTMHAHFQAYIPTFAQGQVEYRRNR